MKITSPTKNNSLLLILIAFFVPVLLYLQTIGFKFTYFDDDGIIVNNLSFLKHFGNAYKAFLTDAFIIKMSNFYRPLQTLSYMVDMHISVGNSAWMFHLTNVLLLGFISCLLFLLLRRLSIPPKLSLLSALIYCVHPLFVSSIAWIPARGDLLLMLFSLLSFLFFIDFLKKGKIIYLFLNWLAFTIALFCKETAIFLPFLFLLYFFTFQKEKPFKLKYIFTVILYVISGLLWYLLRSKAVGDYSNPNEVFGLTAILQNLQSIPSSIEQFFLPFDVAPIPGFTFIKTLLGIVLIVIIIILFINSKERSIKEKVFCLAWFLILMFPPMLYKHPLIDYLDHRFFLPLIGILLFLLFIIPKKWLAKDNIKQYWLMIVIIVFLSSFTFIKSHTYKNPITFYNSAITHNSNSAFSYNNRGHLKVSLNDIQGALNDYDKAIAIKPDFSEALGNRAYVKVNLHDLKGALEDCNLAISLNNRFAKAFCIRGIANMGLGNAKLAIADFDNAISINPNYSEAYNGRGTAFNSLGKHKEALTDFNKAIEIDPKNYNFYENRAIAKYFLKDFSGSIDDCDSTLQLNPNDEKAFNIRAKAQEERQK